jgi:hypothetical protein
LLVLGELSRLGVQLAATDKLLRTAKSAGILLLLHATDVPGAVHDPDNRSRGEKPIKEPRGPRPRFLIAFGDGASRTEFTDDIGAFYERAEIPKAIVLDLRRLGALLVKRVGGPLIKVVEAE